MNASQLIRGLGMSARALDTPLDETGLDTLADWLLSDALPDTTMTLEEFDGLCYALAVGPPGLEAADWLPVVFGVDDMPELEPGAARRFIGLLLRHQRAVATHLARARTQDEEPAYLPWVEDIDDDARIEPVQISADGERAGMWFGRWWAAGFNAAVAEWEDRWMPLLEDEQAGELAEPFALLERGYDELDPQGEFDDEAIFEQCLLAAFEMRLWWLARANPPRSARGGKPGGRGPRRH